MMGWAFPVKAAKTDMNPKMLKRNSRGLNTRTDRSIHFVLRKDLLVTASTFIKIEKEFCIKGRFDVNNKTSTVLRQIRRICPSLCLQAPGSPRSCFCTVLAGIVFGNTPLVGRRFYKHFAKHLKEILISVIESKLYLLEIEMKVLF